MLAHDERQVAPGAGEPERDGLGWEVGRLPVGRHIKLEVARNARGADKVGGHQAVGERGNVERDLQGKSDRDRVGVGDGQIVRLADDQRRDGVGREHRCAARHEWTDKRGIGDRGIVGLIEEHADRQRAGGANLVGELEDVGCQGRPLRHRNDEVLDAFGGKRVGIGNAVAKRDDRQDWSPTRPHDCPRSRASRRRTHPRHRCRRARPRADSKARAPLR